MKTGSVRVATLALGLFSSVQLLAQNPNNTVEDALLRWYQANMSAELTPTCNAPAGLAFDGAHMWVACSSSNSLLEFNVSDGSLVQTVAFSSPSFLIYDGKNIWATNRSAGTITAVEASNGTLGPSIQLNGTPEEITFDGRNLWVALGGSSSQAISKVDISTGTARTIPLTPAGQCVNPVGITYYAPDPNVHIANNLSESLWVVCNANPVQVVELNPLSSSPGQIVGATASNVIGPCTCNNIAFDGRYVWLATSSEPKTGMPAAQQVDTLSNTLTVTNTYLPAGTFPAAVAFDGLYIWVIDSSSSNVFKMLQGQKPAPYVNPGGDSSFLCFDAGNMWISTSNATNGTYSLQKM